MLGLILVILAIILAIIDYAVHAGPYARPWLLHVAVVVGFIGVLIGVSPISLH